MTTERLDALEKLARDLRVRELALQEVRDVPQARGAFKGLSLAREMYAGDFRPTVILELIAEIRHAQNIICDLEHSNKSLESAYADLEEICRLKGAAIKAQEPQ